ncbi:MAG TPA: hypothetical protein DGH68_02610, partial [Bacteroidetes bacterium]|nr:hypothetical protein [Bacteroidota bacterium]
MVLDWLRDVSNVKYMCLVIVLYLSLSIPLLLTWPPPMIDEALFGSTAKTLIDDGHVGTSLVRGLESHAYWQPPLYFLALVPAIEIGGYDLMTLRIFSVLVGGGVILLIFVLALGVSDSAAAKLAALLLACDPHFVNNVKFVRMDGLCMLFVLIALAVLFKPTFESKAANGLLAGIVSAIAAFTHPFGMVAVVVLALWILWDSSISLRERLAGIALFLSPLLLGTILWGLWIIQDIPGFTEQLSYQIARKDRSLLLTIVNTIKQYRNVPLALALPLVSLGFVLPRAIRKRGKLGLLALLLGATIVVVVPKFEIPYHVYIAPFGAMVSAVLLVESWEIESRMKRGMVVFCIGAWL